MGFSVMNEEKDRSGTGHGHQTLPLDMIRRQLLDWWLLNRRGLPWRSERDPYRVLIAELMLRRTQARQVSDVYQAFIQRFPSPEALGAAVPEDIRGILRPLGLHWRADNIMGIAQVLARDGRDALTPSRLLSLPGVGDYVASAVRVFAYGESLAVVDTNTARIAMRLAGLVPTSEPRRDPRVRKTLEALLDTRKPREFNFALIDFGSAVCLCARPKCSTCLLRESCRYAAQLPDVRLSEKDECTRMREHSPCRTANTPR